MLERCCSGIPPFTEAEFVELGAWLKTNAGRLRQQSLPSELLGVGGGRTTTVPNLLFGMAKGARLHGAGELVQDLRWLRDQEESAKPAQPPSA